MNSRRRTQEELNAMFRRMNAGKKSSDLMAIKGVKTAEEIARDYRRKLEKKGVGNLQGQINKLGMKKISMRPVSSG